MFSIWYNRVFEKKKASTSSPATITCPEETSYLKSSRPTPGYAQLNPGFARVQNYCSIKTEK